jgi:hypothetical protein
MMSLWVIAVVVVVVVAVLVARRRRATTSDVDVDLTPVDTTNTQAQPLQPLPPPPPPPPPVKPPKTLPQQRPAKKPKTKTAKTPPSAETLKTTGTPPSAAPFKSQPAPYVAPTTAKRGGQLRRSLVVGGKSWSGVDIDLLFGGVKKDAAFFEGLLKDHSLAIAAWQTVLDEPSQYSPKPQVGVNGRYYLLKSNGNMEDFFGTLDKYNPSREFKEYVKTHWKDLLDGNGMLSSSDGSRAWGLGYQFHLFRKRSYIFGSDAIAKMWAGGPDGGGTRLLRYWLTDEYWFTKPAARGAKTVVLPVTPEWAKCVVPEIRTRLRDGGAKCEFPVGFAMAWQGSSNKDHGGCMTANWHGLWDMLCCVNEIFAGSGASVFSQISNAMRPRIGSAFEQIVENARTNANDFSGYKETGDESKDGYRRACKQELEKSGFQYVLKNFGRL